VQKLSSIVAFILPMQIKVFSENSSLKSEFLQTSFQSIQVFVIKCEKCGKYLPSETFLRRHEKAVHAESKNPNKRVLCNFCSKMFGDAVIFYRHVR